MRRTRGVIRQSLICSLKPLDFLEDGTPLYPILGAQDDDGGADDNPDDDEEEEEDEDDPDEDKDKDEDKSNPKSKSKSKPKETDSQRIRRLNAENKQRREALEEAQKKLRDIEDKDKSELELATRDRDEHKSKAEKAQETITELGFKVAFLTLDTDKYKWHDPEVVMDLLRKDKDLVVDEDGEVEGLADAVKALAKSKPYLLKKQDGDDEDEQQERQVRTSGAPVGSGRRPRKEKLTKAAREARIADKYKMDQGTVVVQ